MSSRNGAHRLDVLTIGRCGVDVYPLQTGVGLEDVETFGKFLGGSPTNVAVAAARLGHTAATVTGVGDDPFGRYVRREMRRLGVDDRYVVVVPELPTPVTFCEVFPPDDFPLYFYRLPSAPDLHVTPADLDLDAIRDSRLFWLSVTGLSQEPSRAAHHAALGPGDLGVGLGRRADRHLVRELVEREHLAVEVLQRIVGTRRGHRARGQRAAQGGNGEAMRDAGTAGAGHASWVRPKGGRCKRAILNASVQKRIVPEVQARPAFRLPADAGAAGSTNPAALVQSGNLRYNRKLTWHASPSKTA